MHLPYRTQILSEAELVSHVLLDHYRLPSISDENPSDFYNSLRTASSSSEPQFRSAAMRPADVGGCKQRAAAANTLHGVMLRWTHPFLLRALWHVLRLSCVSHHLCLAEQTVRGTIPNSWKSAMSRALTVARASSGFSSSVGGLMGGAREEVHPHRHPPVCTRCTARDASGLRDLTNPVVRVRAARSRAPTRLFPLHVGSAASRSDSHLRRMVLGRHTPVAPRLGHIQGRTLAASCEGR